MKEDKMNDAELIAIAQRIYEDREAYLEEQIEGALEQRAGDAAPSKYP